MYGDGYFENNYTTKLNLNFDNLVSNIDEKLKSQRDEIYRTEEETQKKYSEDFLNNIKPKNKKKVRTMNQFLTMDIGSNKATIDLSKVRKQGLIFEKSMFGKKPKIVIYYNDRPDTPEVNFELNSEEEARNIYNNIRNKLNKWAEEANSAKIQVLEKELKLMREQKTAMLEEKEVLMSVFNQFKEMMQIMEDDTKTSDLVKSIKEM